jgi:hypothetical protein
MLHHLAVQWTNLGLADAKRALPALMHSAYFKVWRNNGLGLFSMVQARPLISKSNQIYLSHTHG